MSETAGTGEDGDWKTLCNLKTNAPNHRRDPTEREPEMTVLSDSVSFARIQSYIPHTWNEAFYAWDKSVFRFNLVTLCRLHLEVSFF